MRANRFQKSSFPLILFLVAGFFFSCSKNEDNAKKFSCPQGVSPSANFDLSPAAQSAVSIHTNGKSSSWQIQLSGTLVTSYAADIYDVDLFDTSVEQIQAFHTGGKKVVCYFSAGSSEDWREDYSNFKTTDVGKPLGEWPGENWLDIRSQNVFDIMLARLDLAKTKGCDGVDPDNVNGFQQDSCFSLTENDQLAFNRAIANAARERGLAVGLKNAPELVDDLVTYYDFSVIEQCHYYNECAYFKPFTDANKPALEIEYDEAYYNSATFNNFCTDISAYSLYGLFMPLLLDGSFRTACP